MRRAETRGTAPTLRRMLAAASAGLMLLAASATAEAAPTQFASFELSSGTPFVFTYVGGPTGATFNASTNVTFHFDNLAGPGIPLGDQAATLTLTSNSTTAAQSAAGQVGQAINGAVNTLSIRRTSDNANLLTVTFTGTIIGALNGNVGSLQSSTAVSNTVNYSSQFVDFSGANLLRSFILTLQPIGPVLTVNGGTGFLNNFTTNASGAFTSDGAPRPVPEPGASALMAGGLLLSGAVVAVGHRRRDRAPRDGQG